MKKFFGLALLLLTATSTLALDVPGRANVSWVLPTETECLEPAPATCTRLPLTGELALSAIELYVSQSPIADTSVLTPTAVLAGNATTALYTATVPAGATLYVRTKARNANGTSKYSVQISKVVTIPNVAPGVPTNVSITITIGVASAPGGG